MVGDGHVQGCALEGPRALTSSRSRYLALRHGIARSLALRLSGRHLRPEHVCATRSRDVSSTSKVYEAMALKMGFMRCMNHLTLSSYRENCRPGLGKPKNVYVLVDMEANEPG